MIRRFSLQCSFHFYFIFFSFIFMSLIIFLRNKKRKALTKIHETKSVVDPAYAACILFNVFFISAFCCLFPYSSHSSAAYFQTLNLFYSISLKRYSLPHHRLVQRLFFGNLILRNYTLRFYLKKYFFSLGFQHIFCPTARRPAKRSSVTLRSLTHYRPAMPFGNI